MMIVKIGGDAFRGTPHRLASVFLGSQRGVESRAGFQHGAGDIEQAVGD